MNLSILDDDTTARTNPESALQRAENLACLGVKSVLELCVGPSLRVLSEAYTQHGISASGNDFDIRWKKYWPNGNWIIGDALCISWNTDAVVFAPPVTKGCTGRREDSLPISQVNPSYIKFIARWASYGPNVGVMVLPARSIATAQDRKEYHQLLAVASNFATISPVIMTEGRRRIRKYIDIYMERK